MPLSEKLIAFINKEHFFFVNNVYSIKYLEMNLSKKEERDLDPLLDISLEKIRSTKEPMKKKLSP